MAVVCRATCCPYEKGGTCHRGIYILTQNGQCSYLWTEDGKVRQARVNAPKIDKEKLGETKVVVSTEPMSEDAR